MHFFFLFSFWFEVLTKNRLLKVCLSEFIGRFVYSSHSCNKGTSFSSSVVHTFRLNKAPPSWSCPSRLRSLWLLFPEILFQKIASKLISAVFEWPIRCRCECRDLYLLHSLQRSSTAYSIQFYYFWEVIASHMLLILVVIILDRSKNIISLSLHLSPPSFFPFQELTRLFLATTRIAWHHTSSSGHHLHFNP